MSEEGLVKEVPLPEGWRGRQVGLLDALLWGRREVRQRHALWMLTGVETVDSLLPYIRGWSANVEFNGRKDLAWQEFRYWLRENQGEPLHEGWHLKYLAEHRGDHEKAALVLLDWVAEYVERFGWAPRRQVGVVEERVAATWGALPKEWAGRQVGLVDALLWSRSRLLQGHEWVPLTGEFSPQALYSFTIGWCSEIGFNEKSDPAWEGFFLWLRDVKKEFPGEGWHVKYLRDCEGDHRRAVLKFLDFVDEYVSLQAAAPGR